MTPAAKEGLPAVVGELVRIADALHGSQQQCDEDGTMIAVSRQAVDEIVRTVRTLSALTAEAGKGEEYASRVLDRFVQIIIEEQPEGVEWTRDQRVHAMQRALSTATPAGEWVLVPKVPTPEMVLAYNIANALPPNHRNLSVAGYTAMLAASPRGASAGEGS